MRRIRSTHTYTIAEIAKDLDRDPATVRVWLRQGLPTLGDEMPPLVLGEDLKAWLINKWASRKKPCGPGELFCCKCDAPQMPIDDSASFHPRTDKTITIKGVCHVCGTRQNQTGSLSKLDQYRSEFGALTQELEHLTERSNASVDNTEPPTLIQQMKEVDNE